VGSAKVKVELWQSPSAALRSLQLKISTVVSPAGQAFVPTLTLDEIFADKVYALGARARIKPRDVFDLWWLCDKKAMPPTVQALHTRLQIYPVASGQMIDTATAWLANATLRLMDLQSANAPSDVADDLRRWLPSSWPMNAQLAATMLMPAVAQLKAGIELMGSIIADQNSPRHNVP
jgi:hypothetical protein